jgi:hypothetical protein
MATPSTPRPLSTLLRILDTMLLLIAIVFAGSLALSHWFPLHPASIISILRIALAGSLVLLAWGLARLFPTWRSHQTWSLTSAVALILLSLIPLAGWPLLMMRDVRKAERAHDSARLCALIVLIDKVGPLALAARPARSQALETLRQQVDRDQQGPALVDVICGVLAADGDDPDLAEIKHSAAQRLAPIARASPKHFLLSWFAVQARQHGWEDDPDCRPLLTIEHERTDYGPY